MFTPELWPGTDLAASRGEALESVDDLAVNSLYDTSHALMRHRPVLVCALHERIAGDAQRAASPAAGMSSSTACPLDEVRTWTLGSRVPRPWHARRPAASAFRPDRADARSARRDGASVEWHHPAPQPSISASPQHDSWCGNSSACRDDGLRRRDEQGPE
jgi:hypothetical protein